MTNIPMFTAGDDDLDPDVVGVLPVTEPERPQIESARGIKWDNAARTRIAATVTLSTMPGDVTMLATADDMSEAGRELFARAMAGEFGDIADPEMATPTRVDSIAIADLAFDGIEVTGIETAVGIMGAIAMDVGRFWVFLSTEQPDSSYLPIVQAPGFYADWENRQPGFFEVVITSRVTNEPAMPTRLIITVQRTA